MNVEVMVIKVKTKIGEMPVYLEETQDMKAGRCKDCCQPIYWGLTESGKSFPVSRVFDENRYEYVSHFEICKGK